MSEEELLRTLDPVHFVEVTNSRGGVAPAEVSRMIAQRKKNLAQSRARHLGRIERLEQAKSKMLSDLKAIRNVAIDPASDENTILVSAEPSVDTKAGDGKPAPRLYDGMKISEALSTLAIETNTDDIPDETYRAAKTAVLDALGCACDSIHRIVGRRDAAASTQAMIDWMTEKKGQLQDRSNDPDPNTPNS